MKSVNVDTNGGMRILSHLHKQAGNWSTQKFIYASLNKDRPIKKGTVSGFLSQASGVGIVETRTAKSGRGFEYRMMNLADDPQLAYVKFREAVQKIHVKKNPHRLTEAVEKRRSAGSPFAHLLRVIVEGNISITFKLG